MNDTKHHRFGFLLTKEQSRMILEMALVLHKEPSDIMDEALEEKYNSILFSQILES